MIRSLFVAALLVAANVVHAQEADVRIFSLRRDVALGKEMSDNLSAQLVARLDIESVRKATATYVVQLVTIASDQISVHYWIRVAGEASLTDSERTAYVDSCKIVRDDLIPTLQTIRSLINSNPAYAKDEIILGALHRLKESAEAMRAQYPDLGGVQ
jgi:hypothetical protein